MEALKRAVRQHENLLCCPICHEVYRTAVILKGCGHTCIKTGANVFASTI